jgi:hypothetical protein
VAHTASTCFERDFLDRLGEQLADEADRGRAAGARMPASAQALV